MDRNKVVQCFKRLQNGNDVRGVAVATPTEGRTLSAGCVSFIAAAFAGYVAQKTGKSPESLRIGVGHDSRISASELMDACFVGLGNTNVFDCGLISTPAMFQSTVLACSDFDGAIMLTASHLPFHRNGMKFFTKDGALNKADLSVMLENAADLCCRYGAFDDDALVTAERFKTGDRQPQSFDMVGGYCAHMRDLIQRAVNAEDYEHPLAGLHIIEDAGNGAAGFFATHILQPLGADISGSVYLDPDGHFPNHVPNPEDAAAMAAAQKATLNARADLGVIFDCDGDRGAVVFSDGTEVNRNVLIALLATIVAEKSPGSTIVTDSVTSDELAAYLEKHLGMKHLRYKRGYKNVIDKAVDLNKNGELCELAIETSGHGAFKENYFSDDGAYIATVIICKMAQLRKSGRRIEDLIESLEHPAESREIRFKIGAPDFVSYGKSVLEAFGQFAAGDARFHIVEPNYEGIRIRFDDDEVKGWMLLRMSLHDPAMPMNVEAKAIGGVDIILGRLQPFFDRFEQLVRTDG